jgi:rhodanese-related sulfurtransferase
MADLERLHILGRLEKFNIEVYVNIVLSSKRQASYQHPRHLGKLVDTKRRLSVICAGSRQDTQVRY